MPPSDNRYALFPLFCAGLVFVLLAPLFWLHAEMPAAGAAAGGPENADLYHRVYPAFHYGFGRLEDRQLPAWNPRQYCGTPFLADPAHGVYQPLNLVFLFLPTERAMAVQAFLGLFLMGAFFVLCARAFEVHPVPALIGGIAYAFSGASAAAMSRPELLSAMTWLPLVMWAGREFVREGRYAMAAAGGVALAGLVLSGSGPLTVAGAVLAGSCVLFHALTRGEGLPVLEFRRWSQGVLLAMAVAAALSAAQWLPALFWWRTLDAPGAAFWRFQMAGEIPARLRDLPVHWLMAMARPDTLPRAAYVGIATLILIPAAFFHRAGRRDAVFFALAALACYVTAVAGQGWSEGRWPVAALLLPGSFCLAALAAIGADRLLITGRDPRSPLVWGPALVALAIAAVVFYVSAAPVRGRLLLTVLALLPVLVVRARWLGTLCGVAISALLFVDLYSASTNYYPHPYLDAPACYAKHARILDAAQEQALDGRVLVAAYPPKKALTPNLGMITPLRVANGTQIPLSKDWAHWWDAMGGPHDPAAAVASPLLNYLAARVVLAQGDIAPATDGTAPARWRAVHTDDDVTMYLNDAALPRSYWTPAWRAVRNVDEAIAVLTTPEFDGARECTVEPAHGELEELSAAVPVENSGERPDWRAAPCTVRDESPERVVISVTPPQPGIVVLTDTFAPGWKATVNGHPAHIIKANGVFRGVAVSAEPNEIVYEYRPWPVWAGLIVSLAGLALLTLGAIAAAVRSFWFSDASY
jgi:hypothetical protein